MDLNKLSKVDYRALIADNELSQLMSDEDELQSNEIVVDWSDVEEDELVSAVVEEEKWSGDEEVMVDAADRAERFYRFQQSIIDQTGSGGATDERGRFHFDLQPVRDSRSERMGVRERVYEARLRQTGQFMAPQNLLNAL